MARATTEDRPGLLDSLRTTAATLVAIVHTRLHLLSTDLEEEKEHFVSLVLLAQGAFFCLGTGVLLIVTLLVLSVSESQRLLVLGAMAAIFLALGGAAVALALRKVKDKPRLFDASLAELGKDRQWLAQRQ